MTTENTQSRRERRTARRKNAILEAAAKVIAEQGFHRTTTKDIAEAADIAEGTIYNYFQSKDEVLMAIMEQLANLEVRREQMEEALQEDFAVFVERHFTERFGLARENDTLIAAVLPELLSSNALRAQYGEQLVEPGMAMLDEHLRARINAGHITPIDVPAVTRLVTGTVLGIYLLTLLEDPIALKMYEDPAALAEQVTRFVFHGLEAVTPPDTATDSD